MKERREDINEGRKMKEGRRSMKEGRKEGEGRKKGRRKDTGKKGLQPNSSAKMCPTLKKERKEGSEWKEGEE